MKSIKLFFVAIAVLASVSVANQAQAARKDITCTPTQVLTWVGSRIHVKCSTAFSGIWYFALRTNDPAEAARVLTILTAARASGKNLVISYDTDDTSGVEWGCQANDCRTINAVGF